MFQFIRKKLQFLKQLFNQASQKRSDTADKLTGSLTVNLSLLKQRLGESPDISYRRLAINQPGGTKAVIIFIEGLADKTAIQDHILKPLMLTAVQRGVYDEWTDHSPLRFVKERLLTSGTIQETAKVSETVDGILSGDTALLLDKVSKAILIGTRGWDKRGIEEPVSEIMVKGPRDGFIESLQTNTALLRRRIKHPALTLDQLRVGRRSHTDICLAYLKDVAPENLVAEVKRRIRQINTDAVLGAGIIEQLIEDSPLSLFGTINYTERPDVVTARVLEGRIAILVDGTPVVDTVPALFIENFQSPDDYNFRVYYSTMIRWFRYAAFGLSVISPGLYVALTTFHQEIIPTQLLITMAAATEGTPFPAVIEVIGMGFVFEVLREAGIRLPRPIGQTVSIVGALVIGQAAVSAGLVGAPVVILTAFTAIASFVVPKLIEPGVVLRISLTVLAGFLGVYGMIAGLLITLIHLASLRSFGVSYLAPLVPMIPADLKDVAIRAPIWAMWRRPRSLHLVDPVRQKFRLMPEAPDHED